MVSSQWHSNLRDQPTVEDTAITTDLFLWRQPTKYQLQSIKKRKSPLFLFPWGSVNFSTCEKQLLMQLWNVRNRNMHKAENHSLFTQLEIHNKQRHSTPNKTHSTKDKLSGGAAHTHTHTQKLLSGRSGDFLLEYDWEGDIHPSLKSSVTCLLRVCGIRRL